MTKNTKQAATTAEKIADMAKALREVEKTLKPLGGRLNGDGMAVSAYLMEITVRVCFDHEKLRACLSGAAGKGGKAGKRPPGKK
jgi:hypothetical protein